MKQWFFIKPLMRDSTEADLESELQIDVAAVDYRSRPELEEI